MKARKNIWDLISILRKGRAVALATHYLDEAEHLSDSILIMNEVSILIMLNSGPRERASILMSFFWYLRVKLLPNTIPIN